MDAINWSGVVVALIGIVTAWLSARSARKAAESSANASISKEKVKAEAEAYDRARKMDVQTIERQDGEIRELEEEVSSLKTKVKDLEHQNELLRGRVRTLEQQRRNGG
jgi:TolA-binding protein